MTVPTRILGIGLRGAALPGAALELLEALRIDPVVPLALPAFRREHPVVAALIRRGHPVIAIPADRLRGVATPSQSPRIQALYGTGSLAEACALIAAGTGARITMPRHISADGGLTAALAETDPTRRLHP